ncbi:MAG: TetR/AcrR family transcriptional regulator [Gemmatimonadales bacterium]
MHRAPKGRTQQRARGRRARAGRPAPGPASARDSILDAAESLFARKGFDPTTIKEIGAAAGQNPALLYYYFGSKAELYRAVLSRLMGELVQRGRARVDAAASPVEAIRALVETQVAFLLAHPNASKLFIREMVDHEARRGRQVILEMAAGLFARLCEVIETGQRAGTFRKDLAPRFAAVSVISQVVYFHLARPAVGLFYGLGPDGVGDELVGEFGRHAGEFALRALTRESGSQRAGEPEPGSRHAG